MSSVNKIFIFLFIGIFSSSLYAVDVSNFDIKGIKLGMSKKQVLSNMPCNSPKANIYKIEGKLAWSEFSCKLYKNSYDPDFTVMLNRYNKVIFINRTKIFNITPSWEKLKEKIIKYYGNKNIQSIDNNDVYAFQLCWGECSKKNFYAGKAFSIDSGKFLIIKAEHNTGYKPSIDFLIEDNIKLKKNKEWTNLLEKREKEHKKEKASNIDF